MNYDKKYTCIKENLEQKVKNVAVGIIFTVAGLSAFTGYAQTQQPIKPNNTSNKYDIGPTTPKIIYPKDSITIDLMKTLQFAYNKSTDRNNNPIIYQIKLWETGTDTTNECNIAKFEIKDTAFSIPPNLLNEEGSYSWSVKAYNGKKSATDTQTFKTSKMGDIIMGTRSMLRKANIMLIQYDYTEGISISPTR